VSEQRYDIAILGGGPGGYVAALYAAAKGARVALVERDRVGGICVTVGCIPSKALLDSSHAFWTTTHGEEHGIVVQGASFVLPKAVARKDAIVKQLVGGIEILLKARKVDLITGEGTLVSPGELKVKAADGERSVKANAMIVATGSKVGMPPIKGLAESKPLDNVGALSLQEVPKRLIVIGGGAIGMELSTFFAEIGSKVTVLEMLPQPIGYADPELVRILLRSLAPKGVEVKANAKVTEVVRKGKVVTVTFEIDGKSQSIEGDEVLLGAGRVANYSGVENAGLKTERLGIVERQPLSAKGATSLQGAQALHKSLSGGGQGGSLKKSEVLGALSYMRIEKGMKEINGRGIGDVIYAFEGGGVINPEDAATVERFLNTHPAEAAKAKSYA